MVKNVFVSLPMHGRDDDKIWEKMNSVVEMMKKEPEYQYDELVLIDNFHKDFVADGKTEDRKRIKYLADSISKLADADIVVFCEEWNYSKGCRIEDFVVCEYLGEVDIWDESDDILRRIG